MNSKDASSFQYTLEPMELPSDFTLLHPLSGLDQNEGSLLCTRGSQIPIYLKLFNFEYSNNNLFNQCDPGTLKKSMMEQLNIAQDTLNCVLPIHSNKILVVSSRSLSLISQMVILPQIYPFLENSHYMRRR